jgi:hypothetical protein
MKTLMKLWVLAIVLTPMTFGQAIAQDNDRPEYVIITTAHWNLALDDDSATREAWTAFEKEYLEKVTKKNEYIMSTAVLNHMYTADNSEVLFVTTYPTWEDIEKAQARNTELEKSAWPDDAARRAAFQKQDRYYTGMHSDEIYATLPGAKIPAEQVDSSRVAYFQKVYRAYPADGQPGEFETLRMEYAEKVIHKNPNILAYYPMGHAWGANNRELVDVYIVASLADVAAMNAATADLEKAAWPDEAKRKAFFKKFDKYFTGQHGDYLYMTIPGVSK